MEFNRCPYDGTPVDREALDGGLTIACPTCGAAWQWHNTWLRRIREPDRDAVRRARTGQQPANDRSRRP